VTTDPHRPPYRWAVLMGVVTFAIYLATLSPTTAFWDTSEYIAAAKVLGIPHPPGNPLFTLLAHTWGLFPLTASYAARINLFAALTSAATAALWFLVAERWLREIVAVRWARLAVAAGGVLVGATSWTVWNQSVVNEKVYTVSLLFIAAIAWLTVRWADLPEGPRRDRQLVLIVYLLALTTTNHMMGVLAISLVGVYVLLCDWRSLLKPAVITGIVVAAIVGVSLNYVYLPMRAAQYPPINEGEPVGFFSHALSDVLNRVQYAKPPVTERQADLVSQYGNYLQYFGWQFARGWSGFRIVAAALFGLLGLSGLVTLIRRERKAGLAALALLLTLTVALVYYLNFKYGFSYRLPEQLSREVRERDYFFIASFSFFGVLVALGFGALLRDIVAWLGDRVPASRSWLLASPVLAFALVPLLANWSTASRAHETMAHDFAVDLLQSIAPYGILITAGDNDTFPLWFAQEVEGVRRDVTLANLSLMNTRWHLRQIRRRQTPAFEPSDAIPLWQTVEQTGMPLTDSAAAKSPLRSLNWPKPTNDVLSLTPEELSDSIALPDYVKTPTGVMRVGDVQIRFGGDYLLLADIISALLIRDNLGKRPIYFAWSDAGYPDQTLGLSPYLVTEGFVRRLMPEPVQPSDSIVASRMLGFVNVNRTNELMWHAYHWQTAAKRRAQGWVDPPSGSILQLYSIIYGGMSPILAAKGDSVLAVRADSVAQAVQWNLTHSP
jgi:hypothetical protein